jgi:hypothetical protein
MPPELSRCSLTPLGEARALEQASAVALGTALGPASDALGVRRSLAQPSEASRAATPRSRAPSQ